MLLTNYRIFIFNQLIVIRIKTVSQAVNSVLVSL